MGASEMTGVPWHKEFLRATDDRRHKRRCIYHGDSDYCKHLCMKCIGSSHCYAYKEKEVNVEDLSDKKPTLRIDPSFLPVFKVGDKVECMSKKRRKYQVCYGTVIEVKPDEVTIEQERESGKTAIVRYKYPKMLNRVIKI